MIERFALIIGAMKCGTSSLFSYLAQHSAIAASQPKEVDFFVNDERWAQGPSAYESAWQWDSPRHRVALEASPNYTKVPAFPNAAERIAAYPGKFQFIYIMRNPLDRFESHYGHRVRGGIQRAVRWFKDPVAEFDPHLVATSQYARQLDEFYRRFPARDILLLNLDELSATPSIVLRRVCEFLEVDPAFDFNNLERRHNRFEDPPGTNRRAEAIARLPGMRHLLPIIPRSAKAAVRKLLARRQPQERFRLRPDQREALFTLLTPDLRRLRDEYGFDPSCWKLQV
jgi:hypothetical protein